ncbi:bifunctional phosphoribosylaminoimidazolecarboxamide formyltransferase/IMP cyclohydrolase [Jonesia quinghaiensis]|uniref:bifunctional phosphoribosylaminoimidazolecarboxamide formyltransferase/IMP cyclohydrolase n=1 Tax=Jonesia quinghaiensis TaxID=262806 RepID=UPI0003F53863|nr:bifunctional phosphoribosylaminoimidazolecarboxamide formyltransferase/IMP cyclohydrolase [Jonesia quinghaiensis]
MSATSTPSTPLPSESQHPIRRALISVYDKTGLAQFAAQLHERGVEIVSTGSTASTIAGAGIPVTAVEQLTGFPECLEGRVKTLHPRVHAGILADSRKKDHRDQLAELGIEPFDLVVVNLYPFSATVALGATPDECVEQIDIGGPSMVRAAAKNHPTVSVVVDPNSYDDVVSAVDAGGFTFGQRKRLAAGAFAHTAAYDVAVSSWFAAQYAPDEQAAEAGGFPDVAGATWQRAQTLRYGENPHQPAALFHSVDGGGVAGAEQLHGKEMSYNNYVDADAAWRAAFDHDEPAVAIIKHANPCGIAVGADIATAHLRAHECDPVSAFGGVIAANRAISAEAAERISTIFTEVVIAPAYEDGAVEILTKKKNIRVLTAQPPVAGTLEVRPVSGGVLMQHRDDIDAVGDAAEQWTLAAGSGVDSAVLADLEFAWRAVRAVKSNAILLARDGASVGIGMGQVNRVDSCRLAVERAGEERARGAVAASDAFFPFADGLQVLLDAGVTAVVQPGGSVRDEEVIAAAEAAGISMYFTETRHFAH